VKQSVLLVLIGVIVLGFALRVANLADLSDSPFFTRPMIDGQVYDHWAMDIVHAQAPRAPFYQDPLYPYFLAVIYRVFGHSFWAVYVMQLLLGVVLLGLVFDLTRRLFDARAGAIAALLAALYKPFIFYESQIEKTGLAVFLVALFLWALVRGLNARRAVWPLLAGLFLGLAALTRANLLLFAPLLFVVFLLRRNQDRKTRLRAALLALGGVVLVIAPVSIRNSVLAREFVLTTTQAGQNFYIGNSEYNRTGQYEAPPWVRPNPEFEQSDFSEYAVKAAGHSLSYSQISSFYVHAGLDWLKRHPGDFLELLGRKIVLYFNNFEVPDNQDMYFFARYSWVLRLPLPGFGIVFGLGLAGIILLTGMRVNSISLVAFFFVYALSVIFFFVFSRYRLPALPALLPFAGALPIWLWAGRRQDGLTTKTARHYRIKHEGTKTQRNSLGVLVSLCLVLIGVHPRSSAVPFRKPVIGILVALAAFAVTLYPVKRASKSEAAQCLVNLGTTYYQEGDTTRALATFDEALRAQPGQAAALRNMGIIALKRHDSIRALDLMRRSVQSEPGNPVTQHYLGKCWEQFGYLDSALNSFSRAVRLAPGRVEYRFSLAALLGKTGNLTNALAHYDTMIKLAPDNPAVRHNYAVALHSAGRLEEAWSELQAARRLGFAINPLFEQRLKEDLENRR
jgi:4-amino-4-deoxy-L-arabinose transferase-like glycosyltransferase